MPFAGRSRTATPMLISACSPSPAASPVPASRMNGSRSRTSRSSERTTTVM